MSPPVLIMAGGTGGHVFPALAVASELHRRGHEVHWLGSVAGIESRLVPASGYPLHALRISGVRRAGIARMLMLPWVLLSSLLAALRLVRRLRPGLAVGFGGFASGPGGIAARLCGVPLVVHEQNAVAGLTNRWLAHVATRVLEGFSGAFGDRGITVGNPVREDIEALPEPEARYRNRAGPLRIQILGGSQGALGLNRKLPAALAAVFPASEVQIHHQAGAGRVEEARFAYREAGIEARISEFIDDMARAYAEADLVICRAGASTVAEVAAAGVATVFVPLPTAVDDHQRHNAEWLVRARAARLLPQAELDGKGLARALAGLHSREALEAMAARARAMAFPESAARVSDLCEEVMHGR